MNPIKRLLFITSNRLGDAVLSTGLLAQALVRFTPDEVTIACGPIPAPLFRAVPGLKEIILLDKKEKGLQWLRCWLRTVPRRWDVVIDIRHSLVSYLLFAGKTYRFYGGGKNTHKTAQLAAMMGFEKAPWSKIWLTQEIMKKAEQLMPPGAPILALCPTANWSAKQWPTERFVAAARALPYTRIAVFGAAHERGQADPVVKDLKATHAVLDLVGMTDPLEAAACLARAELCLANDSGLMHIAAAMGTRTLGIFGPSNDREYAPHGPRVAFVRGAPFLGLDLTPHPETLMDAVSVESVVNKAHEIL